MAKRFKPPTPEQVFDYACSLGFPEIDVKHFMDYYEAEDWHYGDGKPVKSWKRCVVTWKYTNKEPEPKCVVCHKPGSKHQVNKKNQRVWLCEKCLECMKLMGYTAWGWLSKSEIEKKVEQGKLKLNPAPCLYDLPQLKSVPKEPNRRAIINKQKDALGIRS